MKMPSLTKSLVVCFTVMGCIAGLSQLSQAESPKGRFACEFNKTTGLFTTYFYALKSGRPRPGQPLTVVNWFSEYFSGSGYTPQTRCEMVTTKFQRALDSGSLGFVTTGIVNGLPVVCNTEVRGGCNTSNVLFTLKPNSNVPETIQKLFNMGSASASARPSGEMALWESSADDDSITINMTQFLETAPAESVTTEPTNPSATPDMPSTPW